MDFEAVFHALPTAFLVLTPDLRVVSANAAYLRNVGQADLREIVGRKIFEAFPANPGDVEGQHRLEVIRGSMERARDTAAPDVLDVLKYDIPDGAGGFVERFWSAVHFPVLDDAGGVLYIVQRNDDITDYVRDRERADDAQAAGERWRRIAASTEADLFSRGRELEQARRADAEAAEALAGLAALTLRLAGVRTTQELVDAVAAGIPGVTTVVLGILEGDHLRGVFASDVGPASYAPWEQGPMLRSLPTTVAALTRERIVLVGAEEIRSYAPEMEAVAGVFGTRTQVSAPLEVDGEVLGALTLCWREERDLTDRGVELLSLLTAQCAQALAHVRTREAEAEAAAAASRLSETMQRNLLTEPADPAGLDVAVRYQPAARELQVGGDWYDAFGLPSGETLFVIGDVAGHDQDAAAVMAQVRNVLRGVAHVLAGLPASVLTALDLALRDLRVGGLATAVLATVDAADPGRDRLLRWTNAGHPPPVLIAPDGTASLLDAEPDLLLGLDPATERTEHERMLPPGSTVLLYTDGLVERRGASLDVGLAWLLETCTRLADRPVERLCDDLLAALPAEVEDDVALLAVRVLVSSATPDLVLSRDPSSVSLARAQVRRACAAGGVDPDTCDSALLLASEVVTNAVVHGRGRVRLHVEASPEAVHVEVGDDSPLRPVLGAGDDPDALGGRGMAIVELVAADWGVRDSEVGKVVWFTLLPETPAG